jgi:prolyl oligopeptidase
VIDHIDDNLIVLTNYKAPKYKLIKINVNSMDIGNWRDILPERKDVLRGCAIVGNKILANYIVDAKSQAEVYDLNGNKLSDIELPSIGTISSISGELNDSIAFYSFSSFTVPPIIVKYNLNTNTSKEFFRPEINFNFDEYETKQVFYSSKDGTLVPMFIVHKKGIELDGNNPTLLYGYGGFNISLLPYFSTARLFWLEQGGIFAVANIRGGGEYGENWYRAGTKLNKQNVFDDFIAAAEYLIKEKYTSPKKLAIQGGSNGGLLIGAVTNQRPDLFKVAIPQVGVMDMLRYHKFTIGWAWANDYGTSNDSIQFLNLYNYSPLHNIKPKTNYPAILVTTADHDDRVVPAHSFKYIATMQEKNPRPKNPALIRIQTRAGHGAGTPTSIQIDEYTDIYAFIMYNMDMKY